jgi:hypothetical protein
MAMSAQPSNPLRPSRGATRIRPAAAMTRTTMATSVRSARTLHPDALEIEQADQGGVEERADHERDNHAAEDAHPSPCYWCLLFGHVTPPS